MQTPSHVDAVLAAFEQVPVGLVAFGAERRVTAFNRNAAGVLPVLEIGAALPDVLVDVASESLSADGAPSARAVRLPDGTTSVVQVCGMRAPDGTLAGGLAALSPAQGRERATLVWQTQPMWDYDRETGALELSPALRTLLGYAASELPDDRAAFAELVHDDDRAMLKEAVRTHAETLASLDVTFRVRHRSGAERHVRARGEAVRDRLGRAVRIVGVFTDVTPLADARQAAEDAAALFEAFAEHSATAMYVIRDGSFVWANARCAEMFGCTVEELLALPCVLDVIVPEERERVAASMQARREGEETVRYSTRGQRRDGSSFVVDVFGGTLVRRGERLVIGTAIDATDRVGAAQTLLEERQKLATILDTLPVGVWLAGKDGTRPVNAAAKRISERGFVSTAPRERWPFARTMATGEIVVGEPLEAVASDGARAAFLATTAPIRDGEGAVTGAVGTLVDVTEARRIAGSLEFERRRLATAFEQSPGFCFVVRRPEHVFELANDAFYRLVGRRGLIGRRAAEAVPELREQGFLALAEAVLETGEPYVGSEVAFVVARGGDGATETRFVDFVLQPIVEQDGSRSGVLVHGIDVTERVRAHAALQASERRAQAQFKAIPVPTFAWQLESVGIGERDFVLVDFNDAAVALSGGLVAHQTGAHASDVFRSSPEVLADMRAALAGARPERREMEYAFEAGHALRLSVTYTAVFPDLVLVHTEDVTERIELEDQLRQAQKMEAVGQLAGGVAHDFNNLLTIIGTCSSFLAEELPRDSALQTDVSDIREAAARAASLTRQLLAFSRRQVLVPCELDLNEVARTIEPMLRRLIGEDIRVVVDADPSLEHVEADRGQIEQVILNLAVNARDAMPEGGILTIATSNTDVDAPSAAKLGVAPGRYAVISVRDTGTGMPPETVARIFEPFFTTKEQGKGTGLGLSTVYGIAKQSNGFVSVESRPGSGSVFAVGLPRRTPTVAGAQVAGLRSAAPTGTERILLVEDEASVRTLTRRLLERQGYTVFEASDGREALALAERLEDGFDLLFTDIVMPELGGRQLHALLAERMPALRVLYMSGYTDDEIVRRGMYGEGAVFLQKPFTADELAGAVRRALAGDPPAVPRP